MERLTWEKAERDKFVSVCGGFDGIPMTNEMYQKLAAYEDVEEQGRLVELPVAVGDTVYKADFGDGYSEPKISERIIRGFKHTAYTNHPFCDIEFFGKTVFLTREEAEAALAAKKGDNDAC